MRLLLRVATAASVIWIGLAWAEQGPRSDREKVIPSRMCAQLVHCGVKSGMRRQYPTRCAAEDDGATGTVPMQGASCTQAK